MFEFPKLDEYERQGTVVSRFSGLDTRIGAKTGSLKAQKNMSSMTLPCLSTRLGRKKLLTINNGEEIVAAYFSDRAYVMTRRGQQTRLYYGDDYSKLSLIFSSNPTEEKSSLMHMFKKTICIFNLNDSETGTSFVSAPIGLMDSPMRTAAPNFTDTISYAGRIVGCYGNQIQSSAYNNIYDWDYNANMDDLSRRAYMKSFPSNTDFTACVTYKNHALFFTEDEMYELYGENPLEFELIKIADVGCLNRHSICQCDGRLYFISREGVYSYNSSMPTKISSQISAAPVKSENGFEAALGGASGVIYASYLTNDGRKLFTYNVDSETWAQEDDIEAIDIVGRFGKTYLVTKECIYETDCEYDASDKNNDGRQFAWETVTSPIYTNTDALKRAVKFAVFVEQKQSGRVEIYASLDDGKFELVTSELFRGCKEIAVLLGDRHYQKLVLKIKGKGEARVHYISQSYVSGGVIK